MNIAISCLPKEYVEDAIEVLSMFGFESDPSFFVESGPTQSLSWISAYNITKEDAHTATGLCFGYCYGREYIKEN